MKASPADFKRRPVAFFEAHGRSGLFSLPKKVDALLAWFSDMCFSIIACRALFASQGT